MTNEYLVAMTIDSRQIALSYINEQGVVVPIPDFDNQHTYAFPNHVRISPSLLSAGVNAEKLDNASHSVDDCKFEWSMLNQVLETEEPLSIIDALYAIGLKSHRDASVYLHNENLSLLLLHPAYINATAKETLKSIMVQAGFSSCELVEEIESLFKLKAHGTGLNSVVSVFVGEDVLSIVKEGNTEHINYNCNYKHINSFCVGTLYKDIAKSLYDLFKSQNPLINLTPTAWKKISKLAENIVFYFLQGERHFSKHILIDYHFFSIAMTHIHFSRFLLSWLNALCDLLHETNTAQPTCDFFSFIELPDYAINYVNQKMGINIQWKKVVHKDYHRGAFAFFDRGARKSHIRISHYRESEVAVRGFDIKGQKEKLDVVITNSSISADSVTRTYKLKPNDKGICAIPVKFTSSRESKIISGFVEILLSHEFEKIASLDVTFECQTDDSTLIGVTSEKSLIRQVRWINNASFLAIRQREIF